jgi:hypothetical protein
MVAMALSVTTIFINSLWGRGVYFFDAIKGVGQQGRRTAGDGVAQAAHPRPPPVPTSTVRELN